MPARDYYLPQRRLVSQEDAAMIENARVPRSTFTGSWTRKTAFDAGYLVPFLLDEVLPGDHMRYNVTAYLRMSTPLFPLFDSQRIDTFFFFVPCRLLWTNWVKFMGEQSAPGDTIDYTIPQIVINVADASSDVGSIYDHFGIPVKGQLGGTSTLSVNALPLRAYNLIFQTWFKDQNINILNFNPPLGNGPDANNLYALLRRSKSHDYFTSALPWPQKFTAPTVPLGGKAPITTDVALLTPVTVFSTSQAGWRVLDAAQPFVELGGGGTEPNKLYADLTAATGVAINTFRQAFMVQALLERDARGGTRYVELLKSHFGVTNPDFRLQRPEYIGGGQTPLQITPIAQTTPGDSGAGEGPLGALGGTGTAAGQHRADYAATEHGYIIGLINVRTELSYQQGLHKMWSRLTRYDFYWPALAGLGEQAILRKEIYSIGSDGGTNENLVFGYQERWHEYRTRTSDVTGIMRSTATGTLDPWHLAQRFTSAPLLNTTFLDENPPMTRVLAAGALAANQQYLADILIQRTAVRPIPTFGTPVTLGRF